MKTVAGVSINASAKTAAKPALSLFAKIAKFVDDWLFVITTRGSGCDRRCGRDWKVGGGSGAGRESLAEIYHTEDAIKWLKS